MMAVLAVRLPAHLTQAGIVPFNKGDLIIAHRMDHGRSWAFLSAYPLATHAQQGGFQASGRISYLPRTT